MDLEKNNNAAGIFLKNTRKEKKMTRYELYKISGVTTAQIKNIENGHCIPRSTTLAKIVAALDVDYDYVYDLFY